FIVCALSSKGSTYSLIGIRVIAMFFCVSYAIIHVHSRIIAKTTCCCF
ncbi:MAG: hypothetical protein ACI9GC_000831, partial [Phycisphaerales bacterium]